ncbi:efflux transporter outer membrane subunit [Tolumonas lignilytica]|uniref:efflux transporter outer membrane subunit n=1 Tax=Tolumonas lignilytica TaxID=1283284 RepID=UPI00046561D4|nr:efflux transporter outer membrane subunit [Tolumonas lignilytica]
MKNSPALRVNGRLFKAPFVIVPIAALAMSACAQAPDHPLSQMKHANEFASSQSLNSQNKISWPDNQWWLRYHDAQLNQLMQEALSDAPTLMAAQARLRNAAGIAEQIGAIRAIQVGASASASETKVSYAYQAYMPPHDWNGYGSVTANFSYDIDFWGKNKAVVAAATSDLAAAEAETQAAKLMIQTSLTQAYAELARLYLNRDTAQTALAIRSKTVELMTERFKNGLETQGVLKQMQALKANADAELVAVDESIQLQKNAIAALLGKGPDRGLSLQRPAVQLTASFGLPENTGINILGHRPDVTAARWRAEAAAKRIHVAKAQFYPDVSISGFIGYQAFGLNNLTKSGNDVGSIGPAIYLPLFTGGRLSGQLTSAEATYDEAVANYNNTVTQALHDVADVMTSSKALKARLGKTEEAYQDAKAAYQIADNRYRGGLATYLDVLTAEDAMLNTQRALVNLQARSFSLDVSLIHALGGGFNASKS